ncbi:MAG: hypothetical protein EA371_13970 [Gammaproteobacteria bacterium]|nr:MAG: hypothetical protein EA371_13970 [Gammaproteobacteria bacterium]
MFSLAGWFDSILRFDGVQPFLGPILIASIGVYWVLLSAETAPILFSVGRNARETDSAVGKRQPRRLMAAGTVALLASLTWIYALWSPGDRLVPDDHNADSALQVLWHHLLLIIAWVPIGPLCLGIGMGALFISAHLAIALMLRKPSQDGQMDRANQRNRR